MPADENRVTEYRYSGDGRLVQLIARNSVTGDQTTTWEYGTTLAESGVASFDLVRAKVYPDDVSGSGRVEYRYNRLGELVGMTDQNATVHQYDYDGLGRLVHDRVTLPAGSAIDGAVLRVSRSYNARGLLETVTSVDNATPGSGTIKDEVRMDYSGFGQVAREYQAHGGAVNTASTPHVDYGYADGTNNTARRLSITYPDGRVVGYGYGAAGSIDDLTDRVATVTDRGSNLVAYTHRGVQSTVRIQYLEPGVELTYLQQSGQPVGDGGDRYTGLDRFNRIEDIRWMKSATGADLDRYQYGFDRAGNRTWPRG